MRPATAYIEPKVHFIWEGTSAHPWREVPRLLYDTELVYVPSGEYVLCVRETRFRVARGSLALIPPGAWHESWAVPEQEVIRQCLHFSWSPHPSSFVFPKQALNAREFDPRRIHPVPAGVSSRLPLVQHLTPSLEQVVRQMFQLLLAADPLGERLLWAVLSTLLDEKSNSSSHIASYPPAVRVLKDLIDRHYMDPLDSVRFSRVTRLSRSRLFSLFKQYLGVSPTEYLALVRLEIAKTLLREGGLSIKEVARASGYPSANYFSRCFRRRVGLRPLEFARTPTALPPPA